MTKHLVAAFVLSGTLASVIARAGAVGHSSQCSIMNMPEHSQQHRNIWQCCLHSAAGYCHPSETGTLLCCVTAANLCSRSTVGYSLQIAPFLFELKLWTKILLRIPACFGKSALLTLWLQDWVWLAWERNFYPGEYKHLQPVSHSCCELYRH